MEKINAVITGISACVPDYILTNDEISTMVDTMTNGLLREWELRNVGY